MNNNSSSTNTAEAIERGLKFLERNQLPSGEFKIYSSADLTLEKDCKYDTSPFPTATISYCLKFSNSPLAKAMIKRALRFLLATMGDEPVWKYCSPDHSWQRNMPPDVDDTALASLVLKQNGIDLPDNRGIILANRNRQGLFYTWMFPRFALSLNRSYWKVILRFAVKPKCVYHFRNHCLPNDIDGTINANVLFYLGETRATKRVTEYLIQIIEQEKEDRCSVWYLNRFTFYYAISRNYYAGIQAFEVVRETIVARILQAAKVDGMIGENVLETALAICALINLRCERSKFEKSIQFLLKAQRESGDWQRIPFYFYYDNPAKHFAWASVAWGSEEITTGFCLEALTRY